MLTGPSMTVVEVQLTGEISDSTASLDVFEQPAVTTKAAEIKKTTRDFMPRD
jgi:hypothetical protein